MVWTKTHVDDDGRVCTMCTTYKPWAEYDRGSGTRGKAPNCKSCMSIRQANTPNEIRRRDCNKYEKTRKGFLMRLYRNMSSRINGVQKKKHHLYKGKPILDKDDFYRWAKSSLLFHILFTDWERSGYDRKLTPSVDRIDSEGGYIIGNMEWVTHSENSRRGACSRRAA